MSGKSKRNQKRKQQRLDGEIARAAMVYDAYKCDALKAGIAGSVSSDMVQSFAVDFKHVRRNLRKKSLLTRINEVFSRRPEPIEDIAPPIARELANI